MKKLSNLLAVKSKEDFWILASFICFFIGLLMQVVIIFFSFAWPDEKFGLPRVSSGLFILASLLTLVPILGFIAFFNFLLLFIFTFHSHNPFSHPWFYHLLGMFIFNIGMILFMIMGRIVDIKSK